MGQYRETCHCSHDVATHYVDRSVSPAARVTCLAGGCDCKRYVNENAPKPITPKIPGYPWWP